MQMNCVYIPWKYKMFKYFYFIFAIFIKYIQIKDIILIIMSNEAIDARLWVQFQFGDMICLHFIVLVDSYCMSGIIYLFNNSGDDFHYSTCNDSKSK